MVDTTDDSVLVRRTLNGDRSAFETIVDRYQKAIFNLAFRMAGNIQDAEDITQSAFMKAFEKLHTYDPKYKFFSWLYRIAVNESLNCIKHKKPFEALDRDMVSGERTPDQQVHADQVSRRVQKALLQLKPDYRVVIVLRHFNGLSYQEISQSIAVPVKTVKSRLFTARQMLKDLLLQQGITAND